MDQDRVKKALLESIAKILKRCGLNMPEVDDSTVIADIEGFKSKMWPYTIAEIAELLGIVVADDINIFLEGKGKERRKRTLSQVVDALIRLSEGQGS